MLIYAKKKVRILLSSNHHASALMLNTLLDFIQEPVDVKIKGVKGQIKTSGISAVK
jgi:hypothetical protein